MGQLRPERVKRSKRLCRVVLGKSTLLHICSSCIFLSKRSCSASLIHVRSFMFSVHYPKNNGHHRYPDESVSPDVEDGALTGEKMGDAVVCFECLPGRGSQYSTSFLAGWSGHLVTDEYAAYKAMAKQNPGVVNTGCWSHVRRRFADLYKANHDPRAGIALKMMSHLFRLERKISHRPPEKIA
ncbi:hypothetical protein EKN34_22490 [Enterobacter asburiae]|nr:hypothetical protein EKN34_22490 [Enterobacter asburiae]